MDLSAGTLLASLIVSSVGLGLFLYGKRALRMPQLGVGLTMMIYPYFVPAATWMWGIALGLLLGLALVLRAGR